MPGKVAFIGLGEMGGPMAGHLARGGYEVIVANRTRAKAEAWAKAHGGRVATSPAEAAKGCALVFCAVIGDEDVRAVASGDGGVLAAMAPGGVFVDHTTTSAELARAMAEEAHARGRSFLDAPVTGAREGAKAGKLAVMVGGEAAALERARPAMDCYAAKVVHIGPSGHGQLAKMVNQIFITANMQALAEGIFFAEQTGLDTERALQAIADGTAKSWWLTNRGSAIHRRDFDRAEGGVDIMVKDVAYVLGEARRLKVPLPLTALVHQFWVQMQARGLGRTQSMALIELLGSLGGKTK